MAGPVDVRRQLSSGKRDITELIRGLQTSAPPVSFLRAVVVEVLNDVALITEEFIEKFEDRVVNFRDIKTAPRNSLIVRFVSAARDIGSGREYLCLPFLDPHLALPVKSGEMVWVFLEGSDEAIVDPRWFCRIPEAVSVDDINYTHADRKYQISEKTTSEKSSKDEAPGFPNGDESLPDASTLNKQDDYEKIVNNSRSMKDFRTQAVPRFTKRPGDFAFQGSNNTLIVLGEDRLGEKPSAADETSSASREGESHKRGRGAIDIVAGRARFMDLEEQWHKGELSAPKTIKNHPPSKGRKPWVEVDKVNPDNSAEGDPDFINDAARLYVSTGANIDEMWELSSEVAPKGVPSGFTSTLRDVKESSVVGVKADEIRIVARKKKQNEPEASPEIIGSLRLIKEGEPKDDLAMIAILSDGTIQLSGKRIALGRTPEDGGRTSSNRDPTKPSGTPKNLEPYMRFSEFKSYMDETLQNMEDRVQSLADDIAQYANTTSAGGVTPGFGGPNPVLGASSTVLASLPNFTSTTDKIVSQKGSTMDKIRSKRVFGE